MLKKFKGVYTALITPFNEDAAIDEKSLESLVEFNIKEGISGLVPCGTTGESPTLSHEEHDRVIEMVVYFSRGRVPVIAGTGSNSTKEAVRLTQHAEEVGANAVLLVSPYYNKPTQEGLYRHFKTIANSTSLPCILYNIPGRCGVNIDLSTLLRIANECKNVVGIKEASGNLEQIKETIRSFKDREFYVLSGDDNLTLDIIREGGHGIISVASNIVPSNMVKLTNYALEGNYERAQEINQYLSPLFKSLFIETNPIPVKYMLSRQKRCKEVYRLPLCEMSEEHKKQVDEVLEKLKLI